MKQLNLNLNKTLSPNSNIVLSSQQAIKSYVDSKKVFVQFLQESAPTTFKAGDKWVNTASNKLFIATNDTTWDNGSNLDTTAIYSFGNLLYHYNGTDTKCYSTISITEQNANKEIKEWFGTQDEYNAIETKDENTHYIIIDDASTSSSLLATQEEFNNSVTDKAATPKQVNEKIGNYLPLAGGNLDGGAILRFTNTNNQVSSMSLDENKYITMSDNLKVSGDINANSLVSTTGNIYKGNSSGATNIWSDSFATAEKAGIIKVGNNLTIAEDGTLNAVAGFGGTKRCIGEVYFSQSSLATDNPGALPGWTGEYYENGKTLFPDLYNFVKVHSELQVTKAQYDNAIATYGECPKYVIDENGASTTVLVPGYVWNVTNTGATNFRVVTKTRNPVAGDPIWASTEEQLSATGVSGLFDFSLDGDGIVYSCANDTLIVQQAAPVFGEWDPAVSGDDATSVFSKEQASLGEIQVIVGTSLRLPKYANYIKMANSTEGITQKGAGLPNITGYASPRKDGYGGGGLADGAFWLTSDTASAGHPATETGPGTRINFDASRSSAVYGNSDTVQPAHTTLYPWISAYTSAIPASMAQAAEFTNALTGKANTDLSNVLANIDYVVESKKPTASDPSWYRVYKSGWVEQGGQTPTVAGGATTTVTLLKPYNNTVYNVVVQPVGAYTGAGEANNVIPTRTTTNFIIACGQIAKQAFSWRAEGQGA